VEGAAESHPHGRCEVKRFDDRIALLMEGYHHINDARQATTNFTRYAKAIGGPFELIVDLGRLESYARDSRLHWLPVLKEHSKSIRCLSLVGGSGLLRMTASAICLYAGLRMRTARSLNEALATPG